MFDQAVFKLFAISILWVLSASCGAPVGNINVATNGNTAANTNVNTNVNSIAGSVGSIDAREPGEYQANIRLTLESIGSGAQKVSTPPLGATAARSGNDRVMEFNLPTNEKVIFLDKGGTNYLILPNRRQYAELNKDALGFEVRRMMMPEQMVSQAKTIQGVRLVGEETVGDRQALRYSFQATANTNTAAGTVATDSYMLIDKETGLPLRTETVSRSQTGNVQGISGVRVVTEMTDIKTTPDASMFVLPTDFGKIDPETVKANVNLIFNAMAAVISQAMNSAQSNLNSGAANSAAPAR